jgi:hypothetical protein
MVRFFHVNQTRDIKLMLYLASPLNPALWGFESLALPDTYKKALEVFHHHSIRRINNSEGRKRFQGIPTINNFVE